MDNECKEGCTVCGIHRELVNAVKKDGLPDDKLIDLAELFKVFGDSTRIKILFVLLRGEMCVCDIAELIGMTQSAVSHQLRILKQSKLVRFRKDGKSVVYSLDDSHVSSIMAQGIRHITE